MYRQNPIDAGIYVGKSLVDLIEVVYGRVKKLVPQQLWAMIQSPVGDTFLKGLVPHPPDADSPRTAILTPPRCLGLAGMTWKEIDAKIYEMIRTINKAAKVDFGKKMFSCKSFEDLNHQFGYWTETDRNGEKLGDKCAKKYPDFHNSVQKELLQRCMNNGALKTSEGS